MRRKAAQNSLKAPLFAALETQVFGVAALSDFVHFQIFVPKMHKM
jgi:hypothetical protein